MDREVMADRLMQSSRKISIEKKGRLSVKPKSTAATTTGSSANVSGRLSPQGSKEAL
jgi:hypothetical protein